MQRSRILWIAALWIALTGFIVTRLVWLQIIDWRYYYELGDGMRRSTTFTSAPRGRILDRYGHVLAADAPEHYVVFTLKDLMKTRWVARRVAHAIGGGGLGAFPFDEDRLLSALEDIRSRCSNRLGQSDTIPRQTWIRQLTAKQAQRMREKLADPASAAYYPGLEVVTEMNGDEAIDSLAVWPQRLFAGEAGVRRLEALLIAADESESERQPGFLYQRVQHEYAEMRNPQRGLERRLERVRERRAELEASDEAAEDEIDRLNRRERSLSASLADTGVLLNIRQQRFERENELTGGVPFAVVRAMAYAPESFPGLIVRERRQRRIESGEALAALIGSVGPPTAEITRRWLDADEVIVDSWLREYGRLRRLRDVDTFDALQPVAHHSADAVGLRGLEKQFEGRLRGHPGARNREIDVRGRPHGEAIWTRPPIPGQDVELTLDVELCEAIYGWLAEMDPRGASVLVGTPENGELLAWCSYPSYDPRLTFDDAESYQRYLAAKPSRLLNRPSSARLPPGSVFKTVVAIAALAEKLITVDEPIECRGYYSDRHPDQLRCRNHAPGRLTVEQALALSCNVYFYIVGGDRLQPEGIARWGRRLHLWDKSGNGAAGRTWGTPPNARSHAQMAGIGRGFTVTPISVFRYTCGLANRGRFPTAVLERGAQTPPLDVVDVPPRVWRTVIAGMQGAVDHGTARWHDIGLYPFDCAVKTGTAEAPPLRPHHPDGTRGDPIEVNHTWINGFAPVEKPQIAFVVNVELSEHHGGEACGPLAAKILSWLVEHRGYGFRLPDDEATNSQRGRRRPR